MKKACRICGNTFESKYGAKTCAECRTAGKKVCTQCGQVFETKSKYHICPSCRKAAREKQREQDIQFLPPEKTEKRIRRDPQELLNAVQAARALGISYGQYSAMRRGFLRV